MTVWCAGELPYQALPPYSAAGFAWQHLDGRARRAVSLSRLQDGVLYLGIQADMLYSADFLQLACHSLVPETSGMS